MRTRLLLAGLAVPMALLSACGDENGSATDPGSTDSPSASASGSASDGLTQPAETSETSRPPSETADPSADWPACADVWADGARLPRGYQGCRDGAKGVKADGRACSFGRPLVVYGDRFYAVPTGVIHRTAGPLEKDGGYRSALASCTA